MGAVKHLVFEEFVYDDDEPSEHPLSPADMQLALDSISAEDWGVDR